MIIILSLHFPRRFRDRKNNEKFPKILLITSFPVDKTADWKQGDIPKNAESNEEKFYSVYFRILID